MKSILVALFVIAIVGAFIKLMPAAGEILDKKLKGMKKDDDKEDG